MLWDGMDEVRSNHLRTDLDGENNKADFTPTLLRKYIHENSQTLVTYNQHTSRVEADGIPLLLHVLCFVGGEGG
jgi:hypothetical protein